jgi:hypothetical protein
MELEMDVYNHRNVVYHENQYNDFQIHMKDYNDEILHNDFSHVVDIENIFLNIYTMVNDDILFHDFHL